MGNKIDIIRNLYIDIKVDIKELTSNNRNILVRANKKYINKK